MATSLTLSFFGDTQLARTIADREEWAADVRPAWDAIADRFQEAERRQFASAGAFGGTTWPPLSPRYAAWKLRQVGSKPILVFSGDLEASLTEQPFGIDVREPQRLILGSDVEYGAHHQKPKVPGRPPQRRPVHLPESERREWVKILQRFLVTGKARA